MAQSFVFLPPANLNQIPKLSLWATQYYIHSFKSGGKIPFRDDTGKYLGISADTCDFCKASLEGTAFVEDANGKRVVLNFSKSGEDMPVNCRACKQFAKSKLKVESWGKSRWKISAGFGDGVQNYRLVPFRTIAVDKNTIPYGSVIYIPSVRGLEITLPNGSKILHDGYFFAGDTGGAIKQNHIDVFTGIYEQNPFPKTVQSNPEKTFEAYLIFDDNLESLLRDEHEKE